MFIYYVRDGEKRYNKFSHPTFTIDVQLFLPKHATGVKVGRRVDSEGMKTRHSLNQPSCRRDRGLVDYDQLPDWSAR